jgi:hypothetical protein
VDGQDEQSLEAITARGFEEGAGLLLRERPDLLLAWPRSLHIGSRVAGYEPVCHRLFECFVKRDMDVPDRARRQPGVQLLAVETTHVGCGEGLELVAPERGLDVHPRYLLVALVSALTHRIPHGVSEPTVQVLANCQLPAGGSLCGDSAGGSLSAVGYSPPVGTGGRFATSHLKRLRFASHPRPRGRRPGYAPG